MDYLAPESKPKDSVDPGVGEVLAQVYLHPQPACNDGPDYDICDHRDVHDPGAAQVDGGIWLLVDQGNCFGEGPVLECEHPVGQVVKHYQHR